MHMWSQWLEAGWCTLSMPTVAEIFALGSCPFSVGQVPPFDNIWEVVLHFQRNLDSSSIAQPPSTWVCIVVSDAFAVSFGMFGRGISMLHECECVEKYTSSYSLADGVMQVNALLPSTFKWAWQVCPNLREVLLLEIAFLLALRSCEALRLPALWFKWEEKADFGDLPFWMLWAAWCGTDKIFSHVRHIK